MAESKFKKLEDIQPVETTVRAALLCGYSIKQKTTLAEFFDHIGIPEVQFVMCTEQMIPHKLKEAFEIPDDNPPLPPEKLPRAMILSGFSSENIRDLLDNFSDCEVPRPIFATTTPVNLTFTVRELLIDILEEHKVMSQKKPAPLKTED